MNIFFRLLFAHIIADFFFQTDRVIKGKESQTSKRHAYQVLHSLTHAIAAYLFVADWSCWEIPLVIFVTHTAMDYIKVEFMKKNLTSFVVDQAFHLMVITALSLSFANIGTSIQSTLAGIIGNPSVWMFVVAYLLVMKPSSILIELFISNWTPPVDATRKSLPNAGKWIGYFERTLILTFIITDNAEAIGYLLAAKSIFRFGEMNKAADIKTTEYVLVGTLASFTIAILVGFAATKLI